MTVTCSPTLRNMLSAKYILTTAAVSLATVIAYGQYQARKAA